MKRLNVTATCMAFYNSGIDVPDEMILEEAIEYAKEHTSLPDVPDYKRINDFKMYVNERIVRGDV